MPASCVSLRQVRQPRTRMMHWQEVFTLLILVVLVVVVADLSQQRPPHLNDNRLRDHNHVHDQKHVQEHLEGYAKVDENMSDDELQFHYFKLHDYNNDNRLDGIELISAITHFEKEDPQAQALMETEISTMVDTILKDEDKNGDGYIDYTEFAISQKSDGTVS